MWQAYRDRGPCVVVLGAEDFDRIVELGKKIPAIVWDLEMDFGCLCIQTANDSFEQLGNPFACLR
jgi:hypothetical protein